MRGSNETGSVELNINHGSESLKVDVTATDRTIAGEIHLNGGLFVTISGNPEDPTFTKPSGDLTETDVLVLLRVVDVVEDVFDFVEDLVDPVDEILILAIIL